MFRTKRGLVSNQSQVQVFSITSTGDKMKAGLQLWFELLISSKQFCKLKRRTPLPTHPHLPPYRRQGLRACFYVSVAEYLKALYECACRAFKTPVIDRSCLLFLACAIKGNLWCFQATGQICDHLELRILQTVSCLHVEHTLWGIYRELEVSDNA